ncbi:MULTISPECIES: hypothetical protein [Methylobacterium]|uniref:Uncharacterized protein n=1 Tax=Methylobacterium jeotgali TaxID=381630 RepID=A0ABQ4STV3_9HYPH|nr:MULTISPECIES: hypothetical protein [Methylobacterium]PIU07864.1 MAG: hypothetical protein COT56_03685 [Methylobacterium sp. CG09_land_8_20_14_0_10_71_15]PIU11063.1 MAG: hypothetical protein COT28_21980 [Methylobacterium sp. CG08_land_8_20_14_0_20_71_15]GBU16024.1 hypothetical protein AwMethylo_02390 [Methylobacterium sp.]GJE05656.1 hypothetical protein AOPFMNJM_0960 [Methylobacterium jeotgali]
MNAPFRLTLLLASSLGGFAVAPIQAADATLTPGRPLLTTGVAEHWRLRPAAPVPVPTAQPFRNERPAGPIPDERRNVRLVYPALVENR